MRKSFLLLTTLLCLSVQAAKSRPNIVFVFTDDQAPWALGMSGHPHADTPNMDRLFKSGAWLQRAYTITPVCSPSRAALMTSRYGTELGITDWIRPGQEDYLGLDSKFPTWPRLLQKAGYKTGLVGKWHLGVLEKHFPTHFGFDHFMGFRTGGNKVINPSLEEIGSPVKKYPGYTYDILTDHALKFIRGNKEETFMLALHYRAPHAAWLPQPESDRSPFEKLDPLIPNPDYPGLDTARVKRITREYLGSVKGVDRNLGRVLGLLDELKLTDNTIVIYSSDHGYSMGHNGIWHKGNGHWIVKDAPPATDNIPRGQRPNMYDNSIFVPTAVRWPGRIKPGTVVSKPFSNLDWFPTILAMAGVSVPKDAVIRGRNGLPLMQGKNIDWSGDAYGEYSTHHQSVTHMRMWRTERWKLVRDYLNPGRDEFFDLKRDPAESINIIHSARPDVREAVRALSRKIVAQMKTLNDPALKMTGAAR
jgi:choline-sulfatase